MSNLQFICAFVVLCLAIMITTAYLGSHGFDVGPNVEPPDSTGLVN